MFSHWFSRFFGACCLIDGLSNIHVRGVHSSFLLLFGWHIVCIFSQVNHISGSIVCGGLHSNSCASCSAVKRSVHFYVGTCFTMWMFTQTVPTDYAQVRRLYGKQVGIVPCVVGWGLAMFLGDEDIEVCIYGRFWGEVLSRLGEKLKGYFRNVTLEIAS